MNQALLQAKLAALDLPGIRWFDTVGSTNDVALDWLASGAAEGCLVAADTQTSGRGRLGRRWITEPGSALAFSVVLKPSPEEAQRLALFSPLGALAVCRALEAGWGLRPEIKWPNDVLLNGRKVCGILVEAAWMGDALQGVVIGIGVNVTPDSVPPEEAVMYPAGCVEEAAGCPVDRAVLLREVLAALRSVRALLLEPAFFEEWDRRLAFKNERVALAYDAQQPQGEDRAEGLLQGVGADGSLLLKLPSGETRAISVGDVHLRPARRAC